MTRVAVKVADKALGFGVNSALSSAFGSGTYELSESSLEAIEAMMSDVVDEAFYADYMTGLADALDSDAAYECTADLALSTCIARAEVVLDDVVESANDWEVAVGVEGVPQFILMTSLELSYVNELIALNEAAGNDLQAESQKQYLGEVADDALVHLDEMEMELEDLVLALGRSQDDVDASACKNSGYGSDYEFETQKICIETLDGGEYCDDAVTVVKGGTVLQVVAVFAETGSGNDCGTEYGGRGEFASEVLRPSYLDEVYVSVFDEGEYDVCRNMLEWYAEYDDDDYEYVGNYGWSHS